MRCALVPCGLYAENHGPGVIGPQDAKKRWTGVEVVEEGIRLPSNHYKPVHLKSAAGTAGMTMKRKPQFEPILSGRTTL